MIVELFVFLLTLMSFFIDELMLFRSPNRAEAGHLMIRGFLECSAHIKPISRPSEL